MKILVVDDDPFIVKGLAKMLGEIPELESVITAFYTDDALEKLKGSAVDLLITDIKMPGASGLDLIKIAKEYNYCRHYIILTGFEKFEFAQKAINYHVDYYLLKPVDKKELIKIVRSLMEQEKGKESRTVRTSINYHIFPGLACDRENVSGTAAKILYYIEQHYTKDISLNEIGQVFGLHTNYICALLKKEIGMTFTEYRNIYRIKKSMEMMAAKPDMAVKDNGTSVGFLNESHFYKVFRRYVGYTPAQFKEKYLTEQSGRNMLFIHE